MTLRRVQLLVAAATWTVAATLAAFFSLTNGLDDTRDLLLFLGWCVPLAVGTGLVLPRLALDLRPRPALVRWAGTVATGLALVVCWTATAWSLLGGSMLAFGVPVLWCWLAAALVGVVVVTVLTPRLPPAGAPQGVGRWFVTVIGLPLAVFGGAALLPLARLYGAIYLWDRAEREIHLLPAGFQGPVVIIYGDSAGVAPEREDGARLYRIPPTGVLRTREGPNEGWGTPQYFYVSPAGDRQAIVAGEPCDDDLVDDPVQACLAGVKSWGGADGITVAPTYSSYVVSRHAARRAMYERGDDLVDSLFAPALQ